MTRYVVEGVARLEQMLVVTFGRAASQELRERVRAQLVEAERVLSDDAADRASVPGSELVDLLLTYDDEQRRLAHRRVVDALVGFDAATIATTHQFCSMVLDSLGRGRRLRLARPAGRGPRRPGEGGRRRPLPAGLRPRRGRPGVLLRRGARRSPAASSTTRRPTSSPRPRTARRTAGRRVSFARRRAHGDGPPQAPARRALLRRPAQPARRRARHPGVAGAPSGCGSGGRSCWSTSSRTPTRCSGRCSTGPSAATPRWC